MGSPALARPGVNGRRLGALALATLAVPAMLATSADAASHAKHHKKHHEHAHASADLTIQAESMTRSSSSAIRIGGSSIKYRSSPSKASKTVRTDAANRLLLRVKGDQCNGAPKAEVTIDGK